MGDRSDDRRIAPLNCEPCGVTMNPHAEKPVVPLTAGEASRVDQALGGLIEEVHQCPHCGAVQSRRA